MSNISKIWMYIIATLLLVPIAGSIVSSEGDSIAPNNFSNEEFEIVESDETTTRSSSSSEPNFKITNHDSVKLPEVNGSWIQDEWIGGGDQVMWDDPSKFNKASGLITTDPTGIIELEKSGYIEAWIELNDGPQARQNHGMVWSTSREVFYIFGGLDNTYTAVKTLYEFNPNTNKYTEKGKTGGPSARCNMVTVRDDIAKVLWVYGGSTTYSTGFINELWAYTPATDKWTKKADAPGAYSWSAGVFDPVNKQIIIYGGHDGDFSKPSNQVMVYKTQTNSWSTNKPFIPRYYHDAVYNPTTKSMLVFGGAEGYSSGYDYVEEVQEYFPETDTWVNHSTFQKWIYPILAWDSFTGRMIAHSGYNPSYNNETWFYYPTTDTWDQSPLEGPQSRYGANGDWDDKQNQFVIFGGRWYETLNDCWAYTPYSPVYVDSGELQSSVFDAGKKVNPRSVSFTLAKPLQTGSTPIKIRVAGSETSPENVAVFKGPDGTANTYFYMQSGQQFHDSFKQMKYLAYKLNISTDNQLFSPVLDSVVIDYYSYPAHHNYESEIYDTSGDYGLPLREVSWMHKEIANTNINIYIRQANQVLDHESKEWEHVTMDQTEFGYKNGKFFQYRVDMTTEESSITPELTGITFTFNDYPEEPTPISPEPEEWLGEAAPSLSWKFNDPDTPDYQTAFLIYIAKDKAFNYLVYTSDQLEGEDSTYTVDKDIEDGEYYWKVKLRDNYESWSPWSEPVFFYVHSEKPATPRIDCYTHSLENIWYADNQPRFDWNEPKDPAGIEGYSYILDQDPKGEPPDELKMTNDEFIMKRQMSDFNGFLAQDALLPSGIWYFHLKAQNTLGGWSDTATRKVMVDSDAPKLVDNSPNKVFASDEITFKFGISDNESGIDIPVIYWRYQSDLEFQFDELLEDGPGGYFYTHLPKATRDTAIFYYVVVTDSSEPINELRYPNINYKHIVLMDSELPVITDCTGSKEHNPFANLIITIDSTDNVGISEARIFFNDEVNGKKMKDNSDGTFSIDIDRLELLELTDNADEDIIYYKIVVWDYNNNMAVTPDYGNFNITLKEIESNDDNKDPKPVEEEVPRNFIVNLISLVVIIIIVAVVLFVFIRKQSEKLTEDRHKLRMAIADVSEGTNAALAAPSGPAAIGAGINSIANSSSHNDAIKLPSSVIDITPTASPPHTQTQPLQGKVSPAGLLPAASGHFPYSTGSNQSGGGFYTDVSMDIEQLHTIASDDDGSKDKKERIDGAVEVEKGLFVTLPKGSESGSSETAKPKQKKAERSASTVCDRSGVSESDSNFWKPPQ